MKLSTVWGLLAAFLLAAGNAQAQSNEAQYRAALTRALLGSYQALPLFRLNPVYPGDVLTLNNETTFVRQAACYPHVKVPNYRGTRSFQGRDALSLSGGLRVGGELLSKKIAEVEAGAKVKFATTGTIRIDPMSLDQQDVATLKSARFADPNCKVINDLLAGMPNGKALVQQVLHGRVDLVLTSSLDASLDAKAKAEALARVTGVLKLNQADISVAGGTASVVVSESPAAMSLAFVPYGFSGSEIARITYYLQGQRGADLEIAVREAIRADVSELEKIKVRIDYLLGKDETVWKDRWIERVVGGDSVEALLKDADKVSFQRLATYGAAMELIRLEAPPRQR